MVETVGCSGMTHSAAMAAEIISRINGFAVAEVIDLPECGR